MRLISKRWFEKKNLLRLLAAALACLLPVCAVAQVSPVEFVNEQGTQNGLVRVKLSSLGKLTMLTLNLQGDYSVNNGQIPLSSGTKAKVSCNASTGQITLSASGSNWNMGTYFTLNRSNFHDSILIAQAQSQNPYPADFSLRSEKTNGGYSLSVIAHIQMEDYLHGVLPFEMGNSSPIEALKAQAIAARTYTIRMMEKRSGNAYDVVDTTADQLYKGTLAGNANCKAAVDATSGMVLKFGSRYAETFYSSSNGGQIESARNIWGGKGYDYLCVSDDPYDLLSGSAKTKTSTIYKDLAQGSNRQSLLTLLEQKAVSCLKQNGYAATTANTQLIRLDKLVLHTPKYAEPSKLYTKADFNISVETVAAGGSSVRTSVLVTADIFGELEKLLGMSLQSSDNEIWTLTSTDTAYTIKAGRFGHGVGMSQHGAMEMARQGYGYDSILGFYYPGCTNVRLNLSNEPMDDAGNVVLPDRSDVEALPDDMADSDAGAPDENTEIYPYTKRYATVLAKGYVNLRQSPSFDAAILGIALEGDTVQIIRLENDWAYVEHNGLQAYAMRRLLSDVFETESTEEIPSLGTSTNVTPTPQPVTTLLPDSKRLMIFCTNGFVNFRETPDLSGSVLMQLPHGAELDKLEVSGEFTKVSYQGIEGYVMSSFLLPVDAFAPQPSQVNGSSSEEVRPMPEETPKPFEETYQAAIVITQRGSLNLREKPYDYATVLTQIPQNAQVEVRSYSSDWYMVRYNGLEGYSMSRFLTLFHTSQPTQTPMTTPAVQAGSSATKAIVTTASGSLNLRMVPEANGYILRTIPQGAMVEVYSMNDEWALVSYQEYSGYVRRGFLTMVQDDQKWQDTITTPISTQKPATKPDATEEVIQQPTATPVPEEWPKPEYNGQLTNLPYGFDPVENTVAMAGAGSARFHLSPSLSERVLYTIPASEQFPVLACSGEWCIGIWNEDTGYVPVSDVTLYSVE